MASNELSKAEQNFTCFAKVSVEFIKLPLIDILTGCVSPDDLYAKIKSSFTLMSGRNKLHKHQLTICFFPLPLLPDYSKFDVTLLYTLIRNLCSSLAPTRGWGIEPNVMDINIGDDIERLRLFRNNCYGHANSAEIPENDFRKMLSNLKTVIQRIYTFTKKWSNYNYMEELSKIENLKFGYEDRNMYKSSLEVALCLYKQLEYKGI